MAADDENQAGIDSPSSDRVPTRERQRLETRRLLLQAGVAEIAEVGLSAARVDRIAAAAGVSRATFYAHFPTKQDLLRELERQADESALAGIAERIEALGTPQELLAGLIDLVFDQLSPVDQTLRREVFALLVREPPPAAWDTNPLLLFLVDRISRAQRDGLLSSETTAVQITRTLMLGLVGFLVIESDPEDVRRSSAHELAQRLIESYEV